MKHQMLSVPHNLTTHSKEFVLKIKQGKAVVEIVKGILAKAAELAQEII